jgi:hypothetical protein
MKFTIATAALLLLLGTTGSAYARQEKADQQEAKPAQKQARPAQQHAQTQAKPAPQQHAKTETKPAERQHAQTQTKPTPTQNTQQAARTEQPHTRAVNHAQPAASAHGRISDAHYAASFGSRHTFHVSQGDYQNRRFQYGGYSFGFVDPWPVGWGYSDNVYVVYVDGNYYMYDPVHPGVRISISIV